MSIPQACNGRHAEIAAAYRFFDNPAANPENILGAHLQQSLIRMAEHSTVLLVQDTTEMDMSQPQRRIQGAGPLDDSPRQGAFVHLMHAFTLEGTPLGSVWHKLLVRAPRPVNNVVARPTRSQRQNTAIEDKESIRWIEGLTVAQSLAMAQPEVRMICLADSEADIYEYLSHLPRTGPGEEAPGTAHWIVRACQDRVLLKSEEEDSGTLWEACQAAPVLWSKSLHVRGRQKKIACDKRARRQPRLDRDVFVEARAVSSPQKRRRHMWDTHSFDHQSRQKWVSQIRSTSQSYPLRPWQAQSMKIGAETFLHDLGHHAHESILFIVNVVGIQGHVVGQSHTHGKHRRWITGFHEF